MKTPSFKAYFKDVRQIKKCTKCTQDKPVNEFYKNKRTRDGKDYYCIACRNGATTDVKQEVKPKNTFIQSIEKTYADGIELIKKKNADYATGESPFRNFEYAEFAGIGVEKAILVRVLDKIARISNLLDKDPDVVEESLEDTLLDVINYLAIMKAYRER